MIQLATSKLTDETNAELRRLQNEIDAKVGFASKAAKAKSLWKSSTSNNNAFTEIKEKLISISISVEICNYCELSENNDIEHVYPKSFFPDKTFVWENYLRVCKQCNTGQKLDSFYVLDAEHEPQKLERGIEPPYNDVAFINPRIEDPSRFMVLNLQAFVFDVLPIPILTKKEKKKAEKTLEILELNTRPALIASRENSYEFYYLKLEKLVNILNANSVEEILEITTPVESNLFNPKDSIENVKKTLTEGCRKMVVTHQHPSIWFAIKTVGYKTDNKWTKLFNAFPDALNWNP